MDFHICYNNITKKGNELNSQLLENIFQRSGLVAFSEFEYQENKDNWD